MVSWIKEFRNFFIASNLWVGLNAGALAWLQFPNLLSGSALVYVLSVMWSTAAAYLYIRLVQKPQGGSSAPTSMHQYFHEWPMGMAVLAFIFSGSALWLWFRLFTLQQWLLMLPAVLIVFLYPLSVKKPLKAFTSLRSFPGLKIGVISLVWTFVCGLMPALLSGAAWDAVQIIKLGVIFLLVIAITIPFDIRDAHRDPPFLRTLPQVMGKHGALQVAHLLLLIAQLLVVVQYMVLDFRIEMALGWLVGLELGQQLIGHCKNTDSALFISAWIEAVPFLLFLSIFISRLWLGSLLF